MFASPVAIFLNTIDRNLTHNPEAPLDKAMSPFDLRCSLRQREWRPDLTDHEYDHMIGQLCTCKRSVRYTPIELYELYVEEPRKQPPMAAE